MAQSSAITEDGVEAHGLVFGLGNALCGPVFIILEAGAEALGLIFGIGHAAHDQAFSVPESKVEARGLFSVKGMPHVASFSCK